MFGSRPFDMSLFMQNVGSPSTSFFFAWWCQLCWWLSTGTLIQGIEGCWLPCLKKFDHFLSSLISKGRLAPSQERRGGPATPSMEKRGAQFGSDKPPLGIVANRPGISPILRVYPGENFICPGIFHSQYVHVVLCIVYIATCLIVTTAS